jgi:hypothetical protein
MKIEERIAVIHLTDEGRVVLGQVGVEIPKTPGVSFEVKETDEQGVWVQLGYEDGPHLLLVKWEYILGMDLPLGETLTQGTVH